MAVKMTKTKQTQPEIKTTIEETKEKVTTTQEEVEQVGDPVVETDDEPLCNAGMSMGFTKNLGNYNNVKVTCSLFVPCKTEEVDETFDAIKGVLEEKLNAIQAEYEAE